MLHWSGKCISTGVERADAACGQVVPDHLIVDVLGMYLPGEGICPRCESMYRARCMTWADNPSIPRQDTKPEKRGMVSRILATLGLEV